MPQIRKTAFAPVLALFLANGCAPAAPPAQVLSDLGVVTTEAGVVPNNGANIVPNNGANLIANNAGSLAGVVKGPAAHLIANNAGSLIGNNAAGLVGNNAAGLIGNNAGGFAPAGYGLLAASALEIASGARVAIFDDRGEMVSEGWLPTDAQGRYRFERLKPSGPVLFVRAEYQVSGVSLSLSSVAAAPREAGERELGLDPATTLAAKKLDTMIKAKALKTDSAQPEAFETLAKRLEVTMGDQDAVAAAVLAPDQAAKVFDGLAEATPELQAALSAVVDATPATPTPAPAGPGTVTSVAGMSLGGYADGTGAKARFSFPYGVAAGPDGTLYVSDYKNHRIRRVTPEGVVTTLAGDGTAGFADGPAAQARFNGPRGVAVDAKGHVYVADADNARIRRIAPDGTVSTLAGTGQRGFKDGAASEAQFAGPRGLALDAAGHVLVADTGNLRIRRIAPDGAVTTAVELAPGAATGGLQGPYAVAVAPDGAILIADATRGAVLRAGADGATTVLAEGFGSPTGLAVGPDGTIFLTDFQHHAIRMIPPGGAITVLAGGEAAGAKDGTGTAAGFYGPYGLCLGADGHLVVADTSNHRIRRVLVR